MIVLGVAASFIVVVFDRADVDPYKRFRRQLGRSILLGLELLAAADIIRAVAVAVAVAVAPSPNAWQSLPESS